jgi:hypothetical protein
MAVSMPGVLDSEKGYAYTGGLVEKKLLKFCKKDV